MLNLELERVFFSGIREGQNKEGLTIWFATFTDSTGMIINAILSEVPPDIQDFVFTPVNAKLVGVRSVKKDKGILQVVAEALTELKPIEVHQEIS